MRRYKIVSFVLLFSLTLCGCSALLERSYSSVEPHSATYWESGEEDTLRADSYQDLVNALLMLVGAHTEEAVVRVYGQQEADMEAFVERACGEVQRETSVGAYMLDYITYSGGAEKDYYELLVQFGYRRTAEEQSQIIGATNSEAIPDILRKTYEQGAGAAAIRVSYFGLDREGVEQLVWQTQQEILGATEAIAAEELWQVAFYPDSDRMEIVEIILAGSGISAEEPGEVPVPADQTAKSNGS